MTTPAAPPPPARDFVRALAAIAALVGSLGLLVFTAGMALAGVAGVGLFALIRRKRGRPMTRFASWIASSVGSAAGVVLIFGALIAASPGDFMKGVQAGMDSARTRRAEREPPAWLEKIAPGTAQQMRKQEQRQTVGSQAVTVWAGVAGGLIGVAMVGAILGSLAWPVAALWSMAITGRWLGAGVPAPQPPPAPATAP